ncbi:RIMS-binding protein 2-like [Megalops cyprinoides]|uniref:RIMS-binding protein 2-like n=1 Tax=Megalops cyprinoides TaxID=118141 RepID=UPI001863C3FC|nr:RIMS-binding protein 2-like [Megalops cyprinoides]
MREVTERRQQLELEHEQALAILAFKQNEVKRLQRAQFAAKKEQEGVVQMLEATVLELEEKCRCQSEQFALLSQELERFRQQGNPDLSQLTNGVPEFGPLGAGLARSQWAPGPRRRVLPSINVASGSTVCTPKFRQLPPKSGPFLHHARKLPQSHEVAAASEVRGLDISAAPVPGRGVTAKLKVFIVRYSYDPYEGPNYNPEVELPLVAGEYICVYGDMDEDGFYEGELMDGRRGLVPSNFVELLSDDVIVGGPPAVVNDLSHNALHEGSFHSEDKLTRFCPDSSERAGEAAAPAEGVPGRDLSPMTNGFDTDTEEAGIDVVPYPRRLTLIKQLAKSIIIGWDPPQVPAGWGNVWSYNVYVDRELRLNVPFGSQTKAVLERLDVNLKAYRVCVQSVTERGTSDQLRCTLLVGRDVCMAPTQLRVDRITGTSARLAWLPSNSNYMHTVSLNDGECWLIKAGGYSLSLSDLRPGQLYKVKVEARSHCTPWELSLYGREHKCAVITFTTLTAGHPAAPLNVRLEAGPSPGIVLVSWQPVSINGISNGVPVTGYTIYSDKRKVLEVSSPTATSALIGPSQIHILQTAQELTVRTMSPQGESPDSVPVRVLPSLMATAAGMTFARPSSPGTHATAPPQETSTAKRNPPVDAHASFVGTSPDAYKVIPTDSATVRPPEVSVNRSSGGVQTSAVTKEPVHLGMPLPTISISECPDHEVSGAEPDTPAAEVSAGPARVPPARAVMETHFRPPSDPLLEEPEAEDQPRGEGARVVSLDEFLELSQRAPEPQNTGSQDNSYLKRPQDCASKPIGVQSKAKVTSDLSDALEEDEGLYSDIPDEECQESCGVGEDGKADTWETDSDEELLERILKSQTHQRKELFSIPEVTEEEDNCEEPEESEQRRSPQIQRLHPEQKRPGVPDGVGHSPALKALQSGGCVAQSDRCFNTKCKPPESPHPGPKPQHHTSRAQSGQRFEDAAQGHSGYGTIPQTKSKSKKQRRVHYSDVVDTISYPEEGYDSDSSVYVPSKGVRKGSHLKGHSPQLAKGGGDQLRREAILRNQMASDRLAAGQYLGSRTVVRTTAPAGSRMEIDVEYGTEDEEEGLPFDPADVVVEEMSSEWWVEGGRSKVLEELRDCAASFQALACGARRTKRPEMLDSVPFEPEAATFQQHHQSRGKTVRRLEYHTATPQRAKLEQTTRSYSADGGYPRVTVILTPC